jgi:hypothetical protein
MPSTAARLATVACLLHLSLGTACNAHPLHGYDDGPQITEKGISVPVPPPSLKAAPIQHVDIEGELGSGDPEPGTVVYLQNPYSDLGAFVVADPDGTFLFEGVEVDLTQNCLEVWSEEPGPYGEMSVHSFFRAYIGDDDQSIVTVQYFDGC